MTPTTKPIITFPVGESSVIDWFGDGYKDVLKEYYKPITSAPKINEKRTVRGLDYDGRGLLGKRLSRL